MLLNCVARKIVNLYCKLVKALTASLQIESHSSITMALSQDELQFAQCQLIPDVNRVCIELYACKSLGSLHVGKMKDGGVHT